VFVEGLNKELVIRDVRWGGMSLVYICEDPSEPTSLRAVKTFRDEALLGEDGSTVDFERRCRRIEREAIAWIGLGHHPNIVQAFMYGRIDGKPHIFLEYVDGPTLAETVRIGRMSLNQWVRLAVQICRGMEHAHSKKLVHRDLKPANILLTQAMDAKVTDFGLAKLTGDISTTLSGEISGTLPYMSPESFTDQGAVDERSDIYSFGVILYEMFTKTKPFPSTEIAKALSAHLELTPAPPSSVNSELPREIDDIILNCLAEEKADRFACFGEVSTRLERLFV